MARAALSKSDPHRDEPTYGQLGKLAALLLDDRRETGRPPEVTNESLLVRALIDQLPDFVFVKDTESRFLVANTALACAYGVANPEALIGKTDFDLHPPAVAQNFFDIEQEVIATGRPMVNMEESFPDSSGMVRYYATTKIPLRNLDDVIVGVVGVARDVTERNRMESFRLEQGLILEMIAKNAPLVEVLTRLMLFVEGQLPGIKGSVLLLDADRRTLHHCAAPSLPQAYIRAIDGLPIGPKVGSCGTAAYRGAEVIVSDIAADPLWEDYREIAHGFGLRSCWSTPILSHEGAVMGTFGMYSGGVRRPNVTESRLIEMTTRIAGIAIERQQSEDRIKFIAHHDALTGLPNRVMLKERLSEAMRLADQTRARVLVVFIDLDNFKVVNDGLGHIAGDQLLKIMAQRMLSCVRGADSVVRLGGDEFVILLTDQPKCTEPPVTTLARIQAAISAPVAIEGRQLQVSCSMGIATYPQDGQDVETLLMNADAAMYGAKEAGRDNALFYTAKMNAKVLERLSLQEQLRKAIERSEFHLVYQPQVDLRTGRIFAVEALLRWDHPVLGLVSPGEFIPIAEESGLIVSIGDWVLRTACRQNKAWQDAGADAITMSVNVSARQFKQSNWTSQVQAALCGSGLTAQYLELELTESMLMQDLQRSVGTMRHLKQMGVQLSIDDFGTGYSSLSALKSFPVSRLKIDQSFVRDLAQDDNDKAIASAVISMGQKLGLRVIAEGVETDEQLAFLRANDCDEIQGYLFSKPVLPDEIERLLTSQTSRTRSRMAATAALRSGFQAHG